MRHLVDIVFRAATYRAAHFLPFGVAIAVMALGAAFLLIRRR
jgi:hypothetical protein